MRRIVCMGFLVGTGLFQGSFLRAANSLDFLEQELTQAKQQHQEATSENFTHFITEVDKAMQSPDAAIQLYQDAGGEMPDDAAVISKYSTETPDEKEKRLAQDHAVAASLAYVVQLQCGLLHYGGFFVAAPDQKGLNEAWINWLKSAAQIYPLAGKTPEDPRLTAEPTPTPTPLIKNGVVVKVKPPRKQVPQDKAREFREKSLRESIISNYLNFMMWGDKEQGSWKVKDIPRLYRQYVLEPLRATPSLSTLSAWDTYIAMKNADQTDRDKWEQVDYPGLVFERCCDDFAISPSTEKLATLVKLVKTNQGHPDIDKWISKVHDLMQDFRAKKSGVAPGTAPVTTTAPAGGPSVTVTTETSGEAQIITTTTNAAPDAPAPPPAPSSLVPVPQTTVVPPPSEAPAPTPAPTSLVPETIVVPPPSAAATPTPAPTPVPTATP